MKSDGVGVVEPECFFDEGVNYYGSDYNVGFTELTLTPRDCCRRCMRDRGCQAWTRLSSGQCWLKFEVPDKWKWRYVEGNVSGRRERKYSPRHLHSTRKIETACSARFWV